MASAEESEEGVEVGKVNRVRRDFSVREDGELAQRMQEDEFYHHYNLNKQERQTVGLGIRAAKEVYIDEIREAGVIPEEQLSQLKSDKLLASELESKIQEEEERKQVEQQAKDEELAKQLQEEEALEVERMQALRREKQQENEQRELKKLQQAFLGLHVDLERSEESTEGTSVEMDHSTEQDSAPTPEMGVRIGVNRVILDDGTEVQLSDDERERENASRRRKDERRSSPSLQTDAPKTSGPKSAEDHRLAMEMQDREIAKFLQRRELYRLEKQREMQLRRAQSVPEGRMGTNGDCKQKSEYRQQGTEPRRHPMSYKGNTHGSDKGNDCDCGHEHSPGQGLSVSDIDSLSTRNDQVLDGEPSRVRHGSRNRSSSPREVYDSPKDGRRRSSRNTSPSPHSHTVNGSARASPRENLSRTSSSSSSRSDRERDNEVVHAEYCGQLHRQWSESPRGSASPSTRRSVSPASRQNGSRSPEERYAQLKDSMQRHRCRRHYSPECQVHGHTLESVSHAHGHRRGSYDYGSDSDEYGRRMGRRPSHDPDSDTESQRSGHHHRRRGSWQRTENEMENCNGFERDTSQCRSGSRDVVYDTGSRIPRRTPSQGSDVGNEVDSPRLRRDVHARRSAERMRAQTMDSPTIRARYIALARSRDQREGKGIDQSNMAHSPRADRSNSCSKIKKDEVGMKISNREAEAILRRMQQDTAEQARMTRTQSEVISQHNSTFESMENGLADDSSLSEVPIYSQNTASRSRNTINIAECIDPTFQRRKGEERVVDIPVARELPPPEPYPDDEPVGRPVIQPSKRRSSEKKKRDGCKNQ